MMHIYRVGDIGKTRDGRKYEVVALLNTHNPKMWDRLAVVLSLSDEREWVQGYGIDGRLSQAEETSLDLVPPGGEHQPKEPTND